MKSTLSPFFKQPCNSLLFLALSGFTTHALAEIDMTGLYSGLQYSSSTLTQKTNTGSKDKISNGHIKARLGNSFNDNFGFEGQLGLATNSNDQQGTLTYGGYLRASKKYGQYKPYGLLGFSGYYSYDGDLNVSESGASLGVGLEIFGSRDLALTFEYLRMIDKTIDSVDETFDTVGIGFTYYFTEDKSYFNKNRNKIRSIRY